MSNIGNDIYGTLFPNKTKIMAKETKQDIYWQGAIYKDCKQSMPTYQGIYAGFNRNIELIDVDYYRRISMDFEDHLASLTSHPVTGTHNFTDGQQVVLGKDYEVRYQCVARVCNCIGFESTNCERTRTTAVAIQSSNRGEGAIEKVAKHFYRWVDKYTMGRGDDADGTWNDYLNDKDGYCKSGHGMCDDCEGHGWRVNPNDPTDGRTCDTCSGTGSALPSSNKEGEQGSEVFRWVRASERVPTDTKDKWLNIGGSKHIGFYGNTGIWMTDVYTPIREIDLPDLEWLEQVPSTPLAAPVEWRSKEAYGIIETLVDLKNIKDRLDLVEQADQDQDFVIQYGNYVTGKAKAWKAAREFLISHHSQFRTQPANKEDMAEGWVSVDKADIKTYPPNLDGWSNDRVLFICNNIIRSGCYDHEMGDWTETGGGIYKDATHWMYLPKPPKTPNNDRRPNKKTN